MRLSRNHPVIIRTSLLSVAVSLHISVGSS